MGARRRHTNKLIIVCLCARFASVQTRMWFRANVDVGLDSRPAMERLDGVSCNQNQVPCLFTKNNFLNSGKQEQSHLVQWYLVNDVGVVEESFLSEERPQVARKRFRHAVPEL